MDTLDSLLWDHVVGQVPSEALKSALEAKRAEKVGDTKTLSWWQSLMESDPYLAPTAWLAIADHDKLQAIKLVKSLLVVCLKVDCHEKFYSDLEKALGEFAKDSIVGNIKRPEIARAWKEIYGQLSVKEAALLADRLNIGDYENMCEIIAELDELVRFKQAER